MDEQILIFSLVLVVTLLIVPFYLIRKVLLRRNNLKLNSVDLTLRKSKRNLLDLSRTQAKVVRQNNPLAADDAAFIQSRPSTQKRPENFSTKENRASKCSV
ncbi:hypothetical protein BWP24_11365 [Vibrio campbellii]|nr:hypothetical protein BWP24_11365 [Vibrio campbellii]